MGKTGYGKASVLIPLVPLLISLFLSCTSTAPRRAAAPGELAPQWEPFAPGIAYFAGRTGKPHLELRALRVNLDTPGLEPVVNGDGGTGQGVIPSTTVSGFVRDYDCIAGINANPFDRVSAVVGEARTIVGITVAGGVPVAPPHPRFDALVFYNDGSAAILSQADLDAEALGTIRNAVGGFFVVLRNGAIPKRLLDARLLDARLLDARLLDARLLDARLPDQDGHGTRRYPRSAAGLSADGRTLYLLVIDGRRPGSVGATEAETGAILKRLGADDGLLFDGGGSTALVLRYPNGKIRPVNTPIHGRIPGKERAVATCLGIRN